MSDSLATTKPASTSASAPSSARSSEGEQGWLTRLFGSEEDGDTGAQGPAAETQAATSFAATGTGAAESQPFSHDTNNPGAVNQNSPSRNNVKQDADTVDAGNRGAGARTNTFPTTRSETGLGAQSRAQASQLKENVTDPAVVNASSSATSEGETSSGQVWLTRLFGGDSEASSAKELASTQTTPRGAESTDVVSTAGPSARPQLAVTRVTATAPSEQRGLIAETQQVSRAVPRSKPIPPLTTAATEDGESRNLDQPEQRSVLGGSGSRISAVLQGQSESSPTRAPPAPEVTAAASIPSSPEQQTLSTFARLSAFFVPQEPDPDVVLDDEAEDASYKSDSEVLPDEVLAEPGDVGDLPTQPLTAAESSDGPDLFGRLRNWIDSVATNEPAAQTARATGTAAQTRASAPATTRLPAKTTALGIAAVTTRTSEAAVERSAASPPAAPVSVLAASTAAVVSTKTSSSSEPAVRQPAPAADKSEADDGGWLGRLSGFFDSKEEDPRSASEVASTDPASVDPTSAEPQPVQLQRQAP